MITTKNWNPVVGSLLSTLQEHGYTPHSVAFSDEEVELYGTDRERRQQAKRLINELDESVLYVKKNDKTKFLFIVLGNDPEDTVCDYSSNEDLDRAVEAFCKKWEGKKCPEKKIA